LISGCFLFEDFNQKYSEGVAFLRSGQITLAISFFNKALQIADSNANKAKASAMLAWCYLPSDNSVCEEFLELSTGLSATSEGLSCQTSLKYKEKDFQWLSDNRSLIESVPASWYISIDKETINLNSLLELLLSSYGFLDDKVSFDQLKSLVEVTIAEKMEVVFF